MNRGEHKMCGTRPFNDSDWDAADAALNQAYALLSVMEVAATETQEFGLINSEILGRAFSGIQHLIAEAHYHLDKERLATASRR